MKTQLFPSAVFLALVSPVFSAPVYWDGSAADLSWGTADNWSAVLAGGGTGALPGTGDVATFNATSVAASTISLNGDRSVSGLDATTSGVVLQGGDMNRTLSLGTGGLISSAANFTVGSNTDGQRVNISLLGGQTWEYNSTSATTGTGTNVWNSVSLGVAGNHTLTLAGSQSSTSPANNIRGTVSDGAGVLAITLAPSNGGNRWELHGNNTYTGLTTISNGALTIRHANALGATSAGTVINSGGSLFFRATVSGTMAAEPITLNGPGRDDKGALRNVAGDNTWQGAVTLASNTRIGADAGNFVFSSTADIGTSGAGNRQLILTGDGTIRIEGGITGDVSILRGTIGVTRMEGEAKSYTGTTTVNAGGTLVVNAALTGTSSVAVNGTLRGTGGTILNTSTVTVGATGVIAPGSFVQTPLHGTLGMGTLTTSPGATLGIDFNSGTLASDVVSVTTLNIASGTLLTVADLGASAMAAGDAILFIQNSGVWNGGLFTVGSTVIQDESTAFTVGMNDFKIDYNYDGVLGQGVALIVVPEPQTAGLALLAVSLLAARRRRPVAAGE